MFIRCILHFSHSLICVIIPEALRGFLNKTYSSASFHSTCFQAQPRCGPFSSRCLLPPRLFLQQQQRARRTIPRNLFRELNAAALYRSRNVSAQMLISSGWTRLRNALLVEDVPRPTQPWKQFGSHTTVMKKRRQMVRRN
jgi:hypothetical protein